jgi:thiosulfate dehydrogenase
MTNTRQIWIVSGAVVLGAAALALADPVKKHALPAAQHGGTVVALCDGETTVEVDGKMTKDKAQAASNQLMAEWRKKHPDADWDTATADNTQTNPAKPAQPSGAGAQGHAGLPVGHTPASQHGIYSGFDTRDELVWAQETQKFVDEGNGIFHDAGKLGGTIAVSCDMCHPNASNTHPESYPKFQVQLGRVALLRDMINWCIENPVKGKPLPDDDRRLRALEAYILAQRKGTALQYGKH